MIRSLKAFWQRISEGMAVQQLWAQFRAEARTGYELYSKEVDWTRGQGESRMRRAARVAQGLFWAMMLKLSPQRRAILLIALILIAFPGFTMRYRDFAIDTPNLAFFGCLGLLVLLTLELADRVTMKRDLEIAREIQSWLMPEAPPRIPGVEIVFATRPANTVAGDYYDAFLRATATDKDPHGANGDGPLLFVVADVAGKSVPAALLMATLQASLRTLATFPASLLQLVERLNQYVCGQNLGGRRFITAFLAELQPATGRLNYINAGHNWPALRRASGVIERLQVGGLPLGIRPGAQYECGEAIIGTGDLLLIFTDGVIEAENDKEEEYGEARLLGIMRDPLAQNAADVLNILMASVDTFVGSARQHDDITCLVLRTVAESLPVGEPVARAVDKPVSVPAVM